MRERIRQTYTSLEIGLMQEENEQLKRRLEKAIEYIKENTGSYYTNIEETDEVFELCCDPDELLQILKGEEII